MRDIAGYSATREISGWVAKSLKDMVARDGVEPPTPAFSELIFPVFPTTSKVAVGLLNTGKYGQGG
jgi:hypothetical protein